MPESFGIGLLCTTRSLGGIELNVLRFARWMRERGHRCLVIGSIDAPLLSHARAEGLPHLSLTSPRKFGDLTAARTIAETMRRERLDILQLNATQDLNLGVLARMVSKNTLRLVHTQHMQFGARKTDLLHRLQHARLEAWVAPLPWLAAQTREFTTIPADRIHIIPFGIDLSAFEQLPSREEARLQFGLPPDSTILGVVGRLDRGKGQEYLLRAAAMLRNEGQRLHVFLVGEDTRGEVQGYGDELRRLTADLALDGHVTFSGFHESVRMAYAAMDCFVLTSLSETYGMVTIEAMAAGLPIVGTDTAGTPEILSGDSGLLLPPQNPAALAHALGRLLRDPQEMNALGNRARSAARARFSHHTQCQRYEELFMQFQRP